MGLSYWQRQLRPLTGMEAAAVEFLQSQPEVAHFISQMVVYLNQLLLLMGRQHRLCHCGDCLYLLRHRSGPGVA
jgi:RNase adaptor protein for sRNA GlmZ degradation